MTSRGEEEVMLDFGKGNLWLLLILQELQEKEHKWSSGKEILKILRNLQKKYIKTNDLDDYAMWR